MAATDLDETLSDEHGQREILRTTNAKLCVHAFVNPSSLWESARKRVPKQRVREDHIAVMRSNSLSHYDLAHKLVPLLHAMKIQNAKVAVETG